MQDDALAAHYRAYIAHLNTRRTGGLQDFVHDRLVHNGRDMSRSDYEDMLAATAAAIPDIRYDVGLLLARGDEVAARIDFHCTPAHEWMGLAPTGRAITFAEHVFYRFRDGRIAQVWSLVDLDAIRAQLGGDRSGTQPPP